MYRWRSDEVETCMFEATVDIRSFSLPHANRAALNGKKVKSIHGRPQNRFLGWIKQFQGRAEEFYHFFSQNVLYPKLVILYILSNSWTGQLPCPLVRSPMKTFLNSVVLNQGTVAHHNIIFILVDLFLRVVSLSRFGLNLKNLSHSLPSKLTYYNQLREEEMKEKHLLF